MKKVLGLILGILVIIAGGIFIAKPALFLVTAGIVLGCSLFVNGIVNLCVYFDVKKTMQISVWYLISAIISIIFGFILLGNDVLKLGVSIVLMYVIAIWFILFGIVRIVGAFKVKKLGNKNWWAFLILGILLIICGIICLVNPGFLLTFAGVFMGVNMIFCGVDLIAISFAAEA